ncbi:MAG TPA: Holliday junction branch migration protein RuvA [Solirubrobacterales bacterium]|jgi:Holliday junction DNA helicase RuvA|nr:Holliday junction branch migration protein RuvA [Solirubrobacterales bacterium]
MIASISGSVVRKAADHVVVEAAGVGYLLNVSAYTLDAVPLVGSNTTLHTELVVREDSMQLYGFATAEERELFTLLTSISGVGPKVALAVLSGMSVPEVETALIAGDAVRFQAVPGIGKRTAERIIVELKDKVVPSGVAVVSRSLDSDDPLVLAREGLLGLGYNLVEVDAMLSGASGETAEELIGAALRGAAA